MLGAFLVALVLGCTRPPEVPKAGTPAHDAALRAFYAGSAALEVGDDGRADGQLAEATRIAPGEAAAWANWGVLALRQGKLDAADQRLTKASELAPRQASVHSLLAALRSKQGRSADAAAEYRRAIEADPSDLRSVYALAQELERLGGADGEAQASRLVDDILTAQLDNLAALLERARLAARRGEAEPLRTALGAVGRRAAPWPAEVREELTAVQKLAAAGDLRGTANRMIRLRNLMVRVPEYRESLAVLKAPPGADLALLGGPLRLEAGAADFAAADRGLRFAAASAGAPADERPAWVGAVRLDGAGHPVVATATATEVRVGRVTRLPFPGGSGGAAVGPSPEGILQLDFSYDFRTDLVLAGAGGVRLHRQRADGSFEDVSAATGLAPAVLNAAYSGAWAVDIESDGDLDIVLGSARGAPVVLRNNGDGTFATTTPFDGIAGLRQFVWLDLDGDGVADVALLDGEGRLHVLHNRRQGQYREMALPAGLDEIKAIATGAASPEGGFELWAVDAKGAVVALGQSPDLRWKMRSLFTLPESGDLLRRDMRLRTADLDNNGRLDLVVSAVRRSDAAGSAGAAIWLGDKADTWVALPSPVSGGVVHDLDDTTGSGHLDLLGIGPDGAAFVARNQPAAAYHWQVVRPRAAEAFGDQRINPFGIGGAVEVRAGAQVQRRPISGPVVHIGLGTATQTDIVRVFWPNGVVQAEFDLKPDQSVPAEQRLKGSCPFLFAYDGESVAFVKDAVPWGSAIGLRINTLGSAAIAATEEWYKIPRTSLAPRDGYYDIRITGELWEVYYYDQLALMSVDHPPGTEIFVDERFVIPPVVPQVTVVETPQDLAGAVDDTGQDVTDTLRRLDGAQVDSFGHGQYQGVTRDHWLELDLGDAARITGPLYLIAHGSLRPTDSSINVALSQGRTWQPRGLVLEAPDGRGGWKVVRDNLGFPAGRRKTILVDLAGVFAAGAPQRVRLRTNLEVYWDQIQWAPGAPQIELKTTRIVPEVADLHYRGYSKITTASSGAPEIPDYQQLSATRQRWRDLEGFYTRYGDVRELLAAADDRYVIMNAGDEMSFRFPVPAAPPAGWLRDFVIAGDGWIKDGDYNSTFSKTVLPLPHHDLRDYDVEPKRLEDEWAYRRHPEDWVNYHTRWHDGRSVVDALRTARR